MTKLPRHKQDSFIRWQKDNRQRRLMYFRKRHLEQKYNSSFEHYEKLLEEQNYKCAICHHVMDVPNIDHDHTTGKMRGLLCGKCNSGLGHFMDSQESLLSAVEYLKKHRD